MHSFKILATGNSDSSRKLRDPVTHFRPGSRTRRVLWNIIPKFLLSGFIWKIINSFRLISGGREMAALFLKEK